MASRLDQQLFDLNTGLMEMGAMCENAIDSVCKALITGDQALLSHAIRLEKQMNETEKRIESQCLRLLLLQHPVARDLRQISAALKMITDMERIGDQASDIAEIVVYLSGVLNRPELQRMGQMANATAAMVHKSVEAFIKRDMAAAGEVIASDDVVDELFLSCRRDLIALIQTDPHMGEAAMDTLMIAKYFERIGDHAVNIAEWVEFSITGEHRSNEE